MEEKSHVIANQIAAEIGVSSRPIQYARVFVDGMDTTEEVLSGVLKDILSGIIKP